MLKTTVIFWSPDRPWTKEIIRLLPLAKMRLGYTPETVEINQDMPEEDCTELLENYSLEVVRIENIQYNHFGFGVPKENTDAVHELSQPWTME